MARERLFKRLKRSFAKRVARFVLKCQILSDEDGPGIFLRTDTAAAFFIEFDKRIGVIEAKLIAKKD